MSLSGGQRQRIGLARAIYNLPKLVILDEPNSSLDDAGEYALMRTITTLKERGSTVIFITHKTNILNLADKILVIKDGEIKAFGPREEVFSALKKQSQEIQKQAASKEGKNDGK